MKCHLRKSLKKLELFERISSLKLNLEKKGGRKKKHGMYGLEIKGTIQ